MPSLRLVVHARDPARHSTVGVSRALGQPFSRPDALFAIHNGWILSREPHLPPDVLEGIHERLRQQGFDPSAFQATPQGAPAPDG
jgi:hypothetical protein